MILREVQFGYRTGTPVIRGVSATLGTGHVCALIGPNAAGKSTLLRLMLGQLKPVRGEVTIDGRTIAGMKPYERAARLAYVPQRPSGNVAFTVAEVVALGRFALPVDAEAIAQAIEACELTAIRDRVFHQLSAGQQQRVALARALAQAWSPSSMEGRFMLLDEPANAMDLRHVHATMSLLKDLAARGLGVLVVLHDLNLASAYADEVWLMHEGRLAAAGPAGQVLTAAKLEPVYEMRLERQGTQWTPVVPHGNRGGL